MSGNGICWAICKSGPRSRQTTMPAPHHSVFFTSRTPFLPPNQQCHSTEGNYLSVQYLWKSVEVTLLWLITLVRRVSTATSVVSMYPLWRVLYRLPHWLVLQKCNDNNHFMAMATIHWKSTCVSPQLFPWIPQLRTDEFGHSKVLQFLLATSSTQQIVQDGRLRS